MNEFHFPRTNILYGTFLFLVLFFHINITLGYSLEDSSIPFDAVIATDQDNYYIYELIIATFSFSSHITSDDYFSFALAQNISLNPIFESEPIQGNFSVSKIYEFSLLALAHVFENDSIPLFVLLYYRNGLFGDVICCYKSISIHKADLVCHGPKNFSEMNSNLIQNYSFTLTASENASFSLKQNLVTYIIKFDKQILEKSTIFTNASGSFSISLHPNKKITSCEIWILVDASVYFNALTVVYHLNIMDNPLKKPITLLGIICLLVLVGVISTYCSVKFYNKYLKRKYPIKTLKI